MIVAGILTPLEDLLRNILNGLHTVLPWSWSIVVLTLIVRMLLVPLTVKQIHSMQNMQAHAPQMKEIQRKYKGDRQKLNEELMKFYKEKNINPASSCLPLVAQIPIFIGLFYTLRNFAKEAKLEGSNLGDLSWLHFVPSVADKASAHWSGWILIVVYVASQLASTYFMSGTMQQSQRVLMMVLPFAFIPFIIHFPTGLVLYWMTTNLWTVGQGLITRRLIPKVAPPTGPKRSSRTPPKEAREDGAAAPAAAKPAAPPRRVKRKKKARR
ncbi:MAG TPA: YidC/Oxa1 family membrane protein insertase [Gaiellaceae bacterium]